MDRRAIGKRGHVNEQVIDSLARHAAAVQDHRRSLKVLGAAALTAAASAPLAAEAGKAGNKAMKKCKKQGNSCRAFAEEICAGFGQGQACVDTSTPCCTSIQKCKAPAFFDCVAAGLEEFQK
jgi:hypothetical protein